MSYYYEVESYRDDEWDDWWETTDDQDRALNVQQYAEYTRGIPTRVVTVAGAILCSRNEP